MRPTNRSFRRKTVDLEDEIDALESLAEPESLAILPTRQSGFLWCALVSLVSGRESIANPRCGSQPVPVVVLDDICAFLAHVERDDVIGAAHYLNRIHELGFRVRAQSPEPGHLDLAFLGAPPDLALLANELLGIKALERAGVATSAHMAVCISLAQTLYRSGDAIGSRIFLSVCMALPSGANKSIMQDIAFAQERLAESPDDAHPLLRNVALGGLGYLDYFKAKYCRRPFDNVAIRSDGACFVCSPSLVPHSIGNAIEVRSAETLMASPMLGRIADSIINQDFRYCRWMHCDKIMNGVLPDATPRDKLEHEPVEIRLSYDPDHVAAPSKEPEKVLFPLLRTARRLVLSGQVDVFASKVCRRILERLKPADFPDLKLDLVSNGMLFSAKRWERLPNIHKMVRSVLVAVDIPGRKAFEKVESRDDWPVLMQNLQFISSLRRQGLIERFAISMVVHEHNVDEVTAFALMGPRFDCDRVILVAARKGNGLSNTACRALPDKAPPRHQLLRRELEAVSRRMDSANETARLAHASAKRPWSPTKISVEF